MSKYKVKRYITFFNGSYITAPFTFYTDDDHIHIQEKLEETIGITMEMYEKEKVEDIRFYDLEKVEEIEVENILPKDIREKYIIEKYKELY